MYSLSAEDNATAGCFLDSQETGPPLSLKCENLNEKSVTQSKCGLINGINNFCVNLTNNVLLSVLNKSAQMSRYKIKLISIVPCKIPAKKFDQSHPVILKNTLRRVSRDETLLDLEINNLKKIGPVSFSIRAYIVNRNSAKDLVFKLEKATCENVLRFRTVLMLDKLFSDNCYGLVGVYRVENINIDYFAGMLQRTITTTGIYAYEIEYSHPAGIIECNVYNSVVTERKVNPKI